ncbi:MAG: SDR family oxidoreductase [Bacteroidota bacterium]|nr:SDR family oxidoreductase [Bacteroidota bacterium]
MINNLLSKKILITGGAGFIGSNIVDYFMSINHQNIVVIDNLETGFISNIEVHLPKITFIKANIKNYEDCLGVTKNCDIVLHQAALGSVPRSIENPLDTHNTNITGFLNMLEAAKQNKVKRFVYASSSSVYGDDSNLPKVEEKIGKPLSPYAVSKKANELYANVFANLYDIEIIGLRYFNVFGPKQNPTGPYAAVIPIFINNILNNKQSSIYGDGTNRRDFTYVDNVVQANLLAASTQNISALNQVYNIAYGSTKSVNDLYAFIKQKLSSEINAGYLSSRVGEIKDSFASIKKANELLNYNPTVNLEDGITKTINWYKQNSFK